MYTVNDFFCGAGGMGLGFKRAGFRIVGAWDFDKYAVETYRENVGAHVQQADITQQKGEDIPFANVWTFGFPCQDLSTAGEKRGLIEGNRSKLFFQIMRLLGEVDRKPDILVAENVKELKKWLPILYEEYKKAGYVMYVKLLNSKHWGVPQNRQRYFVVGVREDRDKQFFRFPEEQTDVIPKLSTVLEPQVDEKYYLKDEKAAKIIQIALTRLPKLDKIHPCMTPDRENKRQNGRRAKENEEPMYTLTAQDIHGVIQSAYTDKDGCAYTCTARYYKGASYADVLKSRNTQIVEEVPDRIGGWVNREDRLFAYQSDKKRSTTQEHIYLKPDQTISDALTVAHRVKIIEQGVLFSNTTASFADVSNTLLSRNPSTALGNQTPITGVAELPQIEVFGDLGHYGNAPCFRVRRLTPREYARLQGFPDNFQFVCSDTQIYKQMGNAVTVPVAETVAKSVYHHLDYILGGNTR